MGTWGPGLYQDDITCDIKEEYRNWLRLTQSNKIATHEVLNNNLCGVQQQQKDNGHGGLQSGLRGGVL